MELTIERAGRLLTVSVVPQAFKERGPSGQEIDIGRIGIGPAAVSYLRSNPIQAVWYGVARTWDMTVLTARGLWKLGPRQLPASTIGGPIHIVGGAGGRGKPGVLSLALFTPGLRVNF